MIDGSDAIWEIGRKRNEKGEPLVVIDGKVMGTVTEIERIILDFRRIQGDSEFSTRVISAVRDAQARGVL